MNKRPDGPSDAKTVTLLEHDAQRLAALVDSSDDAIVSKGLDGTIQTWNDAAERMYGWTAEEAIGRSIDIVIPEPRRREEVAIRDRIARGEDVRHYETFRRHRDSHQFEVSLSISPVKDASGRIVAAAGFARDITDLKHALETRQQLAAIVDSSDDAIVSKGLDGTIQTWNEAAERMYGWTAEEAIGRSIEIVIPESRRSEEVAIRNRIARGEDVRHYETFRQHRDGHQFEVSLSISPVKDASGRIVAAAGFARDITDLKLFETRQQLAALVDSSDDAIVSMDPGGTIETWNEAAERMYGWTAEEAIGRSIDIVIPGSRRDEEVAIRDRIARGEDVRHYETFRQHRDGHQFEVSLSMAPVKDASGAVVAAAGFARDISEQARLRDERARATGLLQRFVAFAAHDFHAPLGRALMQAQRASTLAGRGDVHQAQALLDQVVANCRWMQTRTKGLLMASRLQEDRQLQRSVIDAGVVFDDALKVLRSVESSVADASIRRDDLPEVLSDEALLGFLFQNLVHNACKYRRPDVPAFIRVDAELDDGAWLFNVRDNGRGVRPEIRDGIFEPYVRDDDLDVAGTGIGLSLCKQIVEWHGGSIWVDPGEDGVGAVFRFTLPAAPAP